MDELKELGLSENEVKTYLSLLKLGNVTANNIAKISGLKRSTTYDNLQLLINKGIVSSSKKDSVNYYLASEPEKLLHILDEKKKKIHSIIPKLKELSSATIESSGVTYYDGKKGVLTVLNDVLDSTNGKFYYIGSRKMARIPLKHYPDNFVRRRVDAKIFVEGKLAEEDKVDTFIDDAHAESLSAFTYDKKLNGSKAIMFLYDNKVAFITNVEDPIGVIIKNSKIKDFLFSLLFWKFY